MNSGDLAIRPNIRKFVKLRQSIHFFSETFVIRGTLCWYLFSGIFSYFHIGRPVQDSLPRDPGIRTAGTPS